MQPTTTVRDDNERRIARMGVWIDLAKHTLADDAHAHVRFVFYWIAYEAAYKVEDRNPTDAELRQAFHQRVTLHDGLGLQETLNEHRERIVRLLELRQANPSFWYQGNQRAPSAAQWDARFRGRARTAVNRLDNQDTEPTLTALFESLSLVRNQIVHGGSAGIHSRGRTQVLLGASLLDALIPRFRDSIRSNLEENWGSPPFPRVGAAPDDECPPPWLETKRRNP